MHFLSKCSKLHFYSLGTIFKENIRVSRGVQLLGSGFPIKEFFNEALEFIKQNQSPETIISAVVHLDEKSPHMHLCFVPLTEDKRLCAKEILGNKKKLPQSLSRGC